jgi:hypothetical protein
VIVWLTRKPDAYERVRLSQLAGMRVADDDPMHALYELPTLDRLAETVEAINANLATAVEAADNARAAAMAEMSVCTCLWSGSTRTCGRRRPSRQTGRTVGRHQRCQRLFTTASGRAHCGGLVLVRGGQQAPEPRVGAPHSHRGPNRKCGESHLN